MSEKCVIPACSRTKAMRGLCLICYSRAKKTVEENRSTWEQLETLGLSLPDLEPFDDAFNKAVTDVATGKRQIGGMDASTTRDNQSRMEGR